MAKKKLTPEQEKEIKLLQANNEMYNRSIEEARVRGREDSVERLKNAQLQMVRKLMKEIFQN